jgi:hypothetical protein
MKHQILSYSDAQEMCIKSENSCFINNLIIIGLNRVTLGLNQVTLGLNRVTLGLNRVTYCAFMQ